MMTQQALCRRGDRIHHSLLGEAGQVPAGAHEVKHHALGDEAHGGLPGFQAHLQHPPAPGVGLQGKSR